jgi:hypothetical protein
MIHATPQVILRGAPPAAGPVHARPSAPLAGFAKIHVDGAEFRSRGGSAAAVCRDEAGNYLGSSSLVIDGQTDPATLEAIACRESLALAEDLLLQNFVVSSDCKQVVNDIHKGCQGPYGSVITEIKLRASSFSCNFIFESRAVNGDAHSLAKHSLNLGPGRHVWLVNPHDPTCIPHHVDYHQ